MMKDARFVIPPALAWIVSRLPQTPPAAVLAFALDRLLFPRLPLPELDALLEQPLRIEVSDLGLRLALTLTRRGFRPLPAHVAPRLTLRACARATAEPYTLEAMAEELLALYRRLLGAR